MRRRGVGIQGLKKKKDAHEKFKNVGKEIEAAQIDHIRKSVLVFKENLEAFARKHKLEINQNPQFRRQFSKMCEKIGVDPLASNKGFWAEMLGVGDFYYELSVQIIDVCLSTRDHNGGLIGVGDLLHRVQLRRGRNAEAIETDDIRRAIEKVKVLGNGFDMVNVGHQKMVVSVPVEFNRDHMALLSIAQNKAYTTKDEIGRKLGWPEHRISSALELVLQEGMAWVDSQTGADPHQYWFPALARPNQ